MTKTPKHPWTTKQRSAFVKYLRFLRLNAGWTQQEVARRLEVTQSAYSDWERGRKRPSPAMHKALAELFNKPTNEFTKRLYGLSEKQIA